MYLAAITLVLAGDIELNPGPVNYKYPCGTCLKPVRSNQKGVACDSCDLWYHKACLGMRTCIYDNLGTVSWHCLHCALPNVTVFLGDSLTGSNQNSFDCLSKFSDSIESLDSVCSEMAPNACSSPMSKPERKNRQKKSLKVCEVNFQSVCNKKAEVLHLIDEEDPDIMIGNETWLSENILTSEIFPESYNVLRLDRKGKSGGGVIMALRSEFIVEHIETSAHLEAIFAKVNIRGRKSSPLIVGSVYRPPSDDLRYADLLCKTIEQLYNRNKKSIMWIYGDFNLPDIDWDNYKVSTNQYSASVNQRFIEMIDLCGLLQMVSEPTRQSSILDIFLTNRPTLTSKCVVKPGLSDHNMVVTVNNLAPMRRKPVSRKIHLWKRANIDKLKADCQTFTDELINKHRNQPGNVETIWGEFVSKIKLALDANVPSKMTSVRNHQPWVNGDIKRLSRAKKRAFKKAKLSRKVKDWQYFHSVKKRLRQTCKYSYQNYINDIVTQPEGNNQNKRFWSFLKGMKTDNNRLATLKNEANRLVYDGKSKANLLNDQFVSVFNRDTQSKCPTIPWQYPEMSSFSVTTAGVEKLLKGLNEHKAAGPDELTPKLLKTVAHEIAPALCLLFEKSLESGIVPKDWTHARVTPLYKKGDVNCAENYRPVSLTSIPCKILEHIVCSQINRHLEQYDILTNCQHGFRQRRSCETQLIDTVTDFVNDIEQQKQCDAILLDFSKAFDKVPHHLLIEKLRHYGITDHIQQWIQAFLSKRTQQVVVEGCHSDIGYVSSGVPQGSVLGPLLFLLYINDLPSYVENCKVKLFADDCILYNTITDPDDQTQLQRDLNNVLRWESDWKMAFHPAKCIYMTISLKRSPLTTSYDMRGHQLEKVNSAKYLGVTISSKLSWTEHVDNISGQAHRKLAFIQRNLWHCPENLKKLAYQAMVRPKVEYCASLWDPHTKNNIERLESVQRKAARFVKGDFGRESSVTAMLDDLKWPTLASRRKAARVTMFYKAVNRDVDLDIPLKKQARENHKYIPPASRTLIHVNSFYPSAARVWNKLPENVANAENCQKFKEQLATCVLK